MLDDEAFDLTNCAQKIKESTEEGKREELLSHPLAVSAAGAVIEYIKNTQMSDSYKLRNIEYYSDGQFMTLDFAARRNLELCETMRTKEKKGSLLWVLDRTETPMGKRLIRTWLEHPLLSC
ncbi:MAG: DNA mismatch repair protein MutS, partial [Clostridia bacterium]|nr:DNA mismatch repair protein MutS [Clostridia bacterium]